MKLSLLDYCGNGNIPYFVKKETHFRSLSCEVVYYSLTMKICKGAKRNKVPATPTCLLFLTWTWKHGNGGFYHYEISTIYSPFHNSMHLFAISFDQMTFALYGIYVRNRSFTYGMHVGLWHCQAHYDHRGPPFMLKNSIVWGMFLSTWVEDASKEEVFQLVEECRHETQVLTSSIIPCPAQVYSARHPRKCGAQYRYAWNSKTRNRRSNPHQNLCLPSQAWD